MNNQPQPCVVDMLSAALERAKRGEISSVVLLTMNGTDGHTGYGSRFTSIEDVEAAPGHLRKLEAHVREVIGDTPK